MRCTHGVFPKILIRARRAVDDSRWVIWLQNRLLATWTSFYTLRSLINQINFGPFGADCATRTTGGVILGCGSEQESSTLLFFTVCPSRDTPTDRPEIIRSLAALAKVCVVRLSLEKVHFIIPGNEGRDGVQVWS